MDISYIKNNVNHHVVCACHLTDRFASLVSLSSANATHHEHQDRCSNEKWNEQDRWKLLEAVNVTCEISQSEVIALNLDYLVLGITLCNAAGQQAILWTSKNDKIEVDEGRRNLPADEEKSRRFLTRCQT